MHLRCHTQQQIADAVGVDRIAVQRQIEDFVQNGKFTDLNIFGDFERDGSSRRIDASAWLLRSNVFR